MHFTTILTTLALSTSSSATLTTRQNTPLTPWKITSASSTESSPDGTSVVSLHIQDPNTIRLMRASRFGFAVLLPLAADCTLSWPAQDQPPFGQEVLCEGDSNGNFTVSLLPGSGGETVLDFKIKAVERREVVVLGNYFYREFEGEATFKVGEGYEGSCDDAGACSGQLNGEIEVVQEVTSSVGSCEEYGGCT